MTPQPILVMESPLAKVELPRFQPERASPEQPAEPSEAVTPSSPQAGLPPEEPRPTSAPRSDREADPTDLLDSPLVLPGEVLVGRGIEITTVKPRFGVVAQTTSLPQNPTVEVTFDTTGRPIRVTWPPPHRLGQHRRPDRGESLQVAGRRPGGRTDRPTVHAGVHAAADRRINPT